MVFVRIRRVAVGPVRIDRQLTIDRVHRIPGVRRLRVAVLVGVGEARQRDRIVRTPDVVVHQVAGDRVAAFFQRRHTVIHCLRNVIHDRDMERHRVRGPVAVRHRRRERNVDLVLASPFRMVDLTLQREGVARAATRDLHREDRVATGRTRDRLTVVRIGDRNAVRRQRGHVALTRQRQTARPVRTIVDRERTGCRQRLLVAVGPVRQVILVHAARIHTQFRVIRVFLANRRLARRRRFRRVRRFRRRRVNRRPVIRDRERLGRRGNIIVPIGQRISEPFRQRIATGMVFVRIRRVAVGTVRIDRQRAVLRVNRDTDLAGLGGPVFRRVGERRDFRAVGTLDIVVHDVANDGFPAFLQRLPRVIHRGRHIVDHRNFEAVGKDQTVQIRRIEVKVRTDTFLRHTLQCDVESQDIFFREDRMIQIVHQFEGVRAVRVQRDSEHFAFARAAGIRCRRQNAVRLAERNRIAIGRQIRRHAGQIEAEVQVFVLKRGLCARRRTVRTIVDGDQVVTGQVQIAAGAERFAILIGPVVAGAFRLAQVVFIDDDRFAGDFRPATAGAVRIDVGEVDSGDPVVGAVLIRRLPVVAIRDAVLIRVRRKDQLIDGLPFRDIDRVRALVRTGIRREVELGNHLAVLVGNHVAFFDPFALYVFRLEQVRDREGDAGDVVIEVDGHDFRQGFRRVITQLAGDTRFRGRFDTDAGSARRIADGHIVQRRTGQGAVRQDLLGRDRETGIRIVIAFVIDTAGLDNRLPARRQFVNRRNRDIIHHGDGEVLRH